MSKKKSLVKEWVNDEVYQLLKGAGKIYTLELKRLALEDSKILEVLVKIFLSNEQKLCWHAGWALFNIADTHKEALEKYLPQIVERLPEMQHTSQRHSALRIVRHYDITDEIQQGILVEIGMQFILHNKYPANLKYFSIIIIEKIAKYYPEIKNELALTIEEALPHWTTNYIVKFGKEKLITLR